MRNKPKIVWDEWNIKHIKKHQVEKKEVEQAYTSKVVKRRTYLNRILILGKTNKGRFLTIVVSQEKQRKLYVVSARDMSRKERKYYHDQTKTN